MKLILSTIIINIFGVEINNFLETIPGKIILSSMFLIVVISLITSILILYLNIKYKYLNKKNLNCERYSLIKYFIDSSKDWYLKNKVAFVIILILFSILIFNLIYLKIWPFE